MYSFHSYETSFICWRTKLQWLPHQDTARYQTPGNHVVNQTASHSHIHSINFLNIIIWSYPRIFTPFADSRRLAHFPETLQGKRLGSRAGWPNCNSPTILSSQHLSVTSRPCTPPETHRPLGPLGSDLRYSSPSCNSLKKVMSGCSVFVHPILLYNEVKQN